VREEKRRWPSVDMSINLNLISDEMRFRFTLVAGPWAKERAFYATGPLCMRGKAAGVGSTLGQARGGGGGKIEREGRGMGKGEGRPQGHLVKAWQ